MTTQGRADINTYLPMELLREIFLYSITPLPLPKPLWLEYRKYYHKMTTQRRANINTYLPMELLREIFLYSIEVNQMKSGQLASVCRYWRSVVTSIASLWSTLRVGTWTETEQVATWLHRAYPKKIIIDPQRDSQSPSGAPIFAALQNALTSTGQWNELSIVSFPPENLASQLSVQVAIPMNVLKMLHVAAGCVDTPSFSHLLNLVPTEAPLTELRLLSSFAITHFLQPHWLPVLQNLTVFAVNGRDMHEPFELLPTFTQLQIFEADHLCLPFYEPNASLPLLSTLRKLRLRACSVQWMAGRHFPYLEECAILLPHHWAAIQQHEVQLPSCRKLTYHHYPMTTAQYFHVPEMKAMELRSHDCNDQRVYQHLRHLCRVDGRISKLTTLHLTFQCSEQVLTKVLKYLVPLQELVLSIAHPSPSWQDFLESLAAKPSTTDWPVWEPRMDNRPKWEKWYTSQTWDANVLPHLKYLGIQCSKGFSQSECIDTSPILRLVGWTRAQSTPPLEHLKVWEGRGTMDDIVVDYTGTDYLNKHIGTTRITSLDEIVVRGMVTRSLLIIWDVTPLLQHHSTALLRLLEDLKLPSIRHEDFPNGDFESLILPCLKHIKRLEIYRGNIFTNPLKSHIPLVNTLQWLKLDHSPFSWMLGRSFKALREFVVEGSSFHFQNLPRQGGMQVDLPVCTVLRLKGCSDDHFHFLSCPNVQIIHFKHHVGVWGTTVTEPTRLIAFLRDCSRLQELEVHLHEHLESKDSLMHFVFGDARSQGVWRDIRSVEVAIVVPLSRNNIIASMVGHQQNYEKWWKEFTVIERPGGRWVTARAFR